jgi:hypothetical protein
MAINSGAATPNARQDSVAYEKSAAIIMRAIEQEEKEAKGEDFLDVDDENAMKIPKRPFLLTHSLMVGLAMCLLISIESLAVRNLIIEIRMLGKAALDRLALLATLPVFMFFALFFMVVLIGCLFQLLGPVQDAKTGNTRYYSSRAPRRERHRKLELPHITIQMPVYKEGLKGVIIPTVTSLMAAIAHYEKDGGAASIFICEDGMQTIKPELAEARQKYYEMNNIGWCARPPHGKDGFVRAGKFKKASNMNYCLSFSIKVEDELLRVMEARAQELGCSPEDLTAEQENEMYSLAMNTIIERDQGRTWAAGNVRMGELILLVDCDTRVVSFSHVNLP